MVVYSKMAVLAFDVGDFRDSERRFRQAGRVCETDGLGVECSFIAWNSLAAMYFDFGFPDQAADVLDKAERAGIERLPPNHYELLRWMGNRGGLALVRNRPDEARELFRKALNGWDALGLGRSPDTVFLYSNLGYSYLRANEPAKAAETFEHLYGVILGLPAGIRRSLPMVLSGLAVSKDRMGDRAAARELHREAINTAERILGPDHPTTGRILRTASEFFNVVKERPEAKRLRKRSDDILRGFAHAQGLDQTVDARSFR